MPPQVSDRDRDHDHEYYSGVMRSQQQQMYQERIRGEPIDRYGRPGGGPKDREVAL